MTKVPTDHSAAVDVSGPMRWIKLIALSALFLLGWLALLSYRVEDAALLQGGRGGAYFNYAGFLGALISHWLFFGCGLGAYVLMLLITLHAVRLGFSGRSGGKFFWLGAGLFTLGAMIFFSLTPATFINFCVSKNLGRAEIPDLAIPGGIIGQQLAAPAVKELPAGILRQLIGTGGVMIVAWSLTICGAVLVFISDFLHFPWKKLRVPQRVVVEPEAADDVTEPEAPPARRRVVIPDPEYPEIVEPAAEKPAEPELPEVVEPKPVRPAVAAPEMAMRKISAGEKAAEVREGKTYTLPLVTMLDQSEESQGEKAEEIVRAKDILQQVLEDFKVPGRVSGYVSGPRITRYEITLEPGIKVSKVEDLASNISMNLSAEKEVRILAPIPGRPVVGVEVPNRKSSGVPLRSILESETWETGGKEIPLALGRDISGKAVVMDLAKAPHLLIAGATGTGKSVCINTLVMSLLFHFSPDELKLIMVDPKVVEFRDYMKLPHLLTPIINDSNKAPAALRWAVGEMERRYRILATAGVRNLAGYNRQMEKNRECIGEDGLPLPEKLPYIVIIVDEYGDVMMTEARKDVETSIIRIAQKGRAAGIHLVLATQRPDAKIITGNIKSNLPSRICCLVGSMTDSRVVLDINGAEKLLGKGDMLFKYQASLERLQGAFVSDENIREVAKFVSQQREQDFDESVVAEEVPEEAANMDDDDEGYVENPVDINPVVRKYLKATDGDDVRRALEVIVSEQEVSTSRLQRRLGIGYNRAANIIDILQERKVIGPPSGSGKSREILIWDDLINLNDEEE